MATFAEVAEGVRNAIATYAHALDDGRTDDVVALFCSDGVSAMPGMDSVAGHYELRVAYERWKPRVPQRHLVTNTVISAWSDDEATATSDLVFFVNNDAGWSVAMVGRYRDTLHRDGDSWKFHRRELRSV
jgi:3-phenylpropionate/cinnamic acid dioxygenase small subunit